MSSLKAIQTPLRLKNNSMKCLLCARDHAKCSYSLSDLTVALLGRHGKHLGEWSKDDSERLSDLPQVSKHTTGRARTGTQSCLAPRHLVLSSEQRCSCFISQCALEDDNRKEALTTLNLVFHRTSTSTSPGGTALLPL